MKSVKIRIELGENQLGFIDTSSQFSIDIGQVKDAPLNHVILNAIKNGILIKTDKELTI